MSPHIYPLGGMDKYFCPTCGEYFFTKGTPPVTCQDCGTKVWGNGDFA